MAPKVPKNVIAGNGSDDTLYELSLITIVIALIPRFPYSWTIIDTQRQIDIAKVEIQNILVR